MQKLNQKEKSRGVLLFAFNSKSTNYVNIADQNARLITKFLNLPITLVTDIDAAPKFNYHTIQRVENKSTNFRILKDNSVQEWKNLNRFSAFTLSPYDETLLIDVDYLILTSSLLQIFDINFDYKFYYSVIYPKSSKQIDYMGPQGLPYQWATVIYFKKTLRCELLFSLVSRVQQNFSHYRQLFKIPQASYRNDFAFTIANLLLNGYVEDYENDIFAPMLLLDEAITKIEINKNNLVVRYKHRADIIARQNIHILNKDFFATNEFSKFVDEVCYG